MEIPPQLEKKLKEKGGQKVEDDVISLETGGGAPLYQSPSRMKRLKEHKKEWRLWLVALALTIYTLVSYIGALSEHESISYLAEYFSGRQTGLGQILYSIGEASHWIFFAAVIYVFQRLAVLPRGFTSQGIKILFAFFLVTLNILGIILFGYLLWAYPKFLKVAYPVEQAPSIPNNIQSGQQH